MSKEYSPDGIKRAKCQSCGSEMISIEIDGQIQALKEQNAVLLGAVLRMAALSRKAEGKFGERTSAHNFFCEMRMDMEKVGADVAGDKFFDLLDKHRAIINA